MSLSNMFQWSAAITQHLCLKRGTLHASLRAPAALSPFHLVSVQSQQGSGAIMTLGLSDWLSRLWQHPHPGSGLSFSECVGSGEQKGGGLLNEGSFFFFPNEHSDPVTR